ncbi:hypothetical protein D2V93_15745 [Flagellimonas taeanensis]|jgi:hypothetical protein|uniref:Nitrogen regulatory protein P-II family n=1 Tax=Flagellimonas taeanensis TaxID=1005926 RepID=A0A1M6Y807_9FLAO|nr:MULTISPECIES: hypothetical protein [Allomuricauda]MDC6383846.1 hypothetical protein [Muricauda sp. SK9]MEE1961858.1 hypothetical protein [Allomuricauda taeanensis]RIV48468.1 hypothetical protein D2V93_15745 [Allomuricauda taeanensis]SFC06223.1 hypothetical protein SAMN04487891_105159 [Allomuricauda taeanensis]SHL14169.1 hypothetical protein SAMN05216293_2761 [Allomuricauda taeanensis]
MKMIIVTTVEEYKKEVLKIFKKAGIESFSGSDIDGYKSASPLLYTSSWFPSEKGGAASNLFFSFCEEEKVTEVFRLLKEFNAKSETTNPIRAVEVPIERTV